MSDNIPRSPVRRRLPPCPGTNEISCHRHRLCRSTIQSWQGLQEWIQRHGGKRGVPDLVQTVDSRMLPRVETGGSVLPLCNPRARGSVCACHERATAIQALDRTDHERNLSTWKEALSRALCTPLLHPRHTSRIQQGAAPYRDMQTLRERDPGLRRPSRQDEFGRCESDGLLDRYLAQSPCQIQGPTGCERAEADDPGTGHSHFDTSGRHRP